MINSLKAFVALGLIGMTVPAGTSYAEESLIPTEMVYIGHGPSVMGLDKEEPPDSGKKPTAYNRWMKISRSSKALHDESPVNLILS